MGILVEELSNYYDYFLRCLGFPDLFGKVFLITFKFSLFDFSTTFLQEKLKKNSLISFFIKMRDYNDYFPLIKVIKSKKKKLALTSFYYLGQET